MNFTNSLEALLSDSENDEDVRPGLPEGKRQAIGKSVRSSLIDDPRRRGNQSFAASHSAAHSSDADLEPCEIVS